MSRGCAIATSARIRAARCQCPSSKCSMAATCPASCIVIGSARAAVHDSRAGLRAGASVLSRNSQARRMCPITKPGAAGGSVRAAGRLLTKPATRWRWQCGALARDGRRRRSPATLRRVSSRPASASPKLPELVEGDARNKREPRVLAEPAPHINEGWLLQTGHHLSRRVCLFLPAYSACEKLPWVGLGNRMDLSIQHDRSRAGITISAA